jgi:hypothetical protein
MDRAMEQARVAIPRGIPWPAKGRWESHVLLRQLAGHDERALAEFAGMPLYARVNAFLERVASFEEGDAAELLRRLSIGDRVALMLHVRRLELGDSLDCTVSCVKCGKAMSVVLSAARLLNIVPTAPGVSYSVEASGLRLQVRPLTVLDQDMLLDAKEGEDLEEELARACIVSSDPQLPEKLPSQIIQAIGSKLEEVDPLSDIALDLACPECGHKFRASFNAEDFVFRELDIGQGDLESEVHWLALHYHWSENEILSLPVKRRRKYISLINTAITGAGS